MTLWLMDSDFCCTCGALLGYDEAEMCAFCLENEHYDEDQRLYDGFDDDEPTIGTPEEAWAVALSLTDEDRERLDIKDTTP